jgi:hypothetical protein
MEALHLPSYFGVDTVSYSCSSVSFIISFIISPGNVFP